MGHLGRISFLLTGLQAEGSKRDMQTQIKALDLSVEYLHSMIPSSLRDNEFLEQYDKLQEDAEKEKTVQVGFPLWFHYEKLHLLVDLLDRKGLLTKQVMRAKARKRETKEFTAKEEFE